MSKKAKKQQRPLNPRQAMFVKEYLIDLNATQAAIRAGYAEKTANRTGPRLLSHVGVAAKIEKAQAKRSNQLEVTAKEVLTQWWNLATADARELVEVRVSPCRRCHGEDGYHQWVNKAEFTEALEAWELKAAVALAKEEVLAVSAPNDHGGYGYDITAKPNPTCHNCYGKGIERVHYADTRELSPGAAALFNGAEQTMGSLKISTRDRDRALEMVAKHLGMFTERHEVTLTKPPSEMSDEELEQAAEDAGL